MWNTLQLADSKEGVQVQVDKEEEQFYPKDLPQTHIADTGKGSLCAFDNKDHDVAKIPLKFVIKKRKQPNPETPILIAEEIDLDNVIEAQILSYMWVKISQEVEAQENVKLVLEQHMLDKDVNKLVEGKESVANQFADDMIRSQEDPDIRIDPGSQKEIRKMVKVTKYVAINEEEEEETAKAELIQKKRKGSLEIRDTPLATPTRSPRTETLSLDKDVLKELMTSKPTTSKSFIIQV
ncbi:hypothetical protein Tco_0469557 [Tanacetum coccineum]